MNTFILWKDFVENIHVFGEVHFKPVLNYNSGFLNL